MSADWFTVPSSIIAVITGSFVLWDRIFRYTPTAFIVSESPIPAPGAARRAYLHVVNHSERPILLTWPPGDRDNVLGLSVDHSRKEIIRSLMDGEIAVPIEGKAARQFPVFPPPNWPQLDLDQTIETTIRWSFAQPMICKFDRTITVRITKRSYLLLTDNRDDLDAG